MVNYKLKYLKYKTKYINSQLNGSNNTIDIDDETQFLFQDQTYNLITQYEGCRLSLSIGYNKTLSNIAVEEQIKLYQNDEEKDNTEVDLFLHELYAGSSPSGYVRTVLCKLLIHLVTEKVIDGNNIICLEASGNIADSAIALIQMYESMGFRIYSFNAAENSVVSKNPFSTELGVEFTKDKNGMIITSKGSGWPDQLGKLRSRTITAYALMYTNISNLLHFCNRRFKLINPTNQAGCSIM